MAKNLVAIIIENERVLLLNNDNSLSNSLSFPIVKSDSPNELLSMLSSSLKSFSFENAKIYPFVSFPVEQTYAYLIRGYTKNGSYSDSPSLVWFHGYLNEFNYDRLTSRLLMDLQREDLIMGSNYYIF